MVALPRYHHQYLPDRVFHEPDAFTPAQRASLEARGHELQQSRRLYGNMNVVTWDFDGNRVAAATDPRGLSAGLTY
jgi:gamma-glutamyltranspeptidase/glutathione hydrolase